MIFSSNLEIESVVNNFVYIHTTVCMRQEKAMKQ